MSMLAAIKQLFPGKPSWSANQLPDLSSKVALVTGGNAGIGRETVKRLLMKNATVYIASRSKERAERAIDELHKETGRKALFLQLDLADLQSVKKAAEEYKQRESKLDALILNAGVVYPPEEQKFTAQGYDATFGINVIGHFLFHRLLYPVVSASGSEADFSRIVWLSSSASQYPRAFNYEAFRDGPAHAKVHPFIMYAQSKLAAIMLSMRLARHCTEDNVASIAVDPGSVKSEIYRSSPWYIRTTDWMYSYPVEYGAVGPLLSAGAPEAAEYNGKYLKPWAVPSQPSPFALNVEAQDELWAWLEEQVREYL